MLEDIANSFKFEYTIELGVIEGNSKNDRKKEKSDLTNAELLFILENGSPTRNIPPRPVLDYGISWAEKNLLNIAIDNAISAYLTGTQQDLEKELNKACIRIQNHTRSLIYNNDGTFADNAQSTIARKGFNHPLFVTGQLARSIVCILTNEKGEKV